MSLCHITSDRGIEGDMQLPVLQLNDDNDDGVTMMRMMIMMKMMMMTIMSQ